jgi:UDP-N-acetylglucosamine/UDP-N-acetylgalactosamine diphosphorylase
MSNQVECAVGAGGLKQHYLTNRLSRYGQEHLVAFWDILSPSEQQHLAEQIESIDFDRLARLLQNRHAAAHSGSLAARAEPPPAIRRGRSGQTFDRVQAYRRGMAAVRAGNVGMILVAGGQGTRLGANCPKGLFPVGPLSGRSLLQILIDRLLAVRQRYAARIPLYLMTSPATHAETVAYLAKHERFGLPADDLFVFCQGVMPAVCSVTGRVLLSSPGAVALSPDGHGGVVEALNASGGLDDMHDRGIEQLYYCQVDNPLAPVCDPELIGRHLLAGSEMTVQVIARSDASERVGNVVSIDGKVRIIEYTELPPEAAALRMPDGELKYWAANIAIHVFDAALLRRAAAAPESLPFHQTHRAAPFVAEDGRLVAPIAPNAIKLERFVFDLLPLAQSTLVVEANRADVFAPVKNADGAASDTTQTAQAAMNALYRRWLEKAGIHVPSDVVIEIHPSFALDAEEAAEKLPRGLVVERPTYFDRHASLLDLDGLRFTV